MNQLTPKQLLLGWITTAGEVFPPLPTPRKRHSGKGRDRRADKLEYADRGESQFWRRYNRRYT